jgi:hypothetical protein
VALQCLNNIFLAYKQAFISIFLSFQFNFLPGSSATLFIMVNTTVADAAAPKVLPPGHGIDSGPEPNSTSPAIGSIAGQEEEDEGKPAKPQLVYGIAKGDKEGKVNHHIPEMVWFHKFEDTSTANIRKVLELKDTERSERVLHILVSRKLRPITKLSGRVFLSAWWHIVVCM